MLVSIATYNRLSFTQRTVQSVLEQIDLDNDRLAIADDGSDDGTQEWLRELKAEDPRIIVSLGYTRLTSPAKLINHNLALRKPGEFFCSVDNDTVLSHDALSQLLAYFVMPWVGVVALRPPNAVGHFPIDDETGIELTPYLPNSCTMINSAVLDQVGFYFPYPFTAFDYDISYRAYKLGYRVGYAPEIKFHDLGRNKDECAKHDYGDIERARLEKLAEKSREKLADRLIGFDMGRGIYVHQPAPLERIIL